MPNVIVILADDLGYGDVGCYNPQSKAPTPHLDRLAAQGMRFTDSHSPSSVCTPTRYALLTGRYCWRSRLTKGVLQGYAPMLLEPGRLTIGSMLQSRGYATAAIGKWHLGFGDAERVDYFKPLRPGPNDVGFDYFFGIPASLDIEPYVYIENDRCVEPPTETIEGSGLDRKPGYAFWRAGAIAPGFRHVEVLPKLGEKAVQYIEGRASEPGQPFFLYMPLTSPHTPWLPTQEFVGRSGAGPSGDFVTQTDHVIGQVMEAVRRIGAEENTIVIVTSDNGSFWTPEEILQYGHRANGDWRGQKSDLYEGGHRVPFLVRWPARVKAGQVSSQLTTHTDILATVAQIIAAPLPPDAAEDSFSFLHAMEGRAAPPHARRSAVHHSGQGRFAFRAGDWKLIEGLGSGGFTPPANPKPKPGDPAGQLYNLADDPGEQNNLYDHHPQVVGELTRQLDEVRNRPGTRPPSVVASEND